MNNSIMIERAIQHCETLLNENFRFEDFASFGKSTSLLFFAGDSCQLSIAHFGFLTRQDMVWALNKSSLKNSYFMASVDGVSDEINNNGKLILDIKNNFEIKKLEMNFPTMDSSLSNIYLFTPGGERKALLILPDFFIDVQKSRVQKNNKGSSRLTRKILGFLFKYKSLFYPIWRKIPFSIRTKIRLRIFHV